MISDSDSNPDRRDSDGGNGRTAQTSLPRPVQLSNSIERSRREVPPVRCRTHADREAEMFCLVCRQSMCCRCALTKHQNNTRNHDCRDIDDVIAESRKQYGDEAAECGFTLKHFRQKKNELQTEEAEMLRKLKCLNRSMF